MSQQISVSGFLISRIQELGVQHVFGIPGDYVLPFFDELIKEGSPVKQIGTCNELNAAYLADGYSRVKGFGVAAVTYGPGAFNAVNAVAGAFDAHVPLLLVSGAPQAARYREGKKLLLHHAVGSDLTATIRVFTPITAAAARIETAEEAIPTIDWLLRVALDQKRPVYLEIPFDMQRAEVPVPGRLNYQPPSSDEQALRKVVEQVAQAVNGARKVGVLVGVFVDREGLQQVVEDMLSTSRLPFATTFDQKAGYLEHLPNCVGFYQGGVTPQPVKDATEGADILLTLGMPRTEFNLGFLTHDFKEDRMIELGHDTANVMGEEVHGVYLRQLVPLLAHKISPRAEEVFEDTFPFTYTKQREVPENRPLTVDFMYPQLAHFVQEGDIVTGNTGGYINMSRMRLKKGNTTVGPTNWASLGSVFPISIGMAFAAPERRIVCLDGDGSFQMTGTELCTLLRHNLNFLLIILNNAGYTAERAIHPDRDDSYNDIQVWNYHLLPHALGGRPDSNGVDAHTEAQFVDALSSYSGKGLQVVNARLDKMDMPSFFIEMSDMLKH